MVALAPNREKYDRARFYPINGVGLPSVTTINDVLDKPGLMYWAANMERRAMETALLDVLSSDGAKDPEWVLGQMATRLTKAKAFVKEKDKAAAIGTAAHAWIEWETRRLIGEKVGKEPDNIPDAASVSIESWKDWAKEVSFKPIWAERTVYCWKCGYAGTLDWLGEVRRVLTLGDLKTAKAIYPEAYLQNIAYRHAVTQCTDVRPEQGLILRLPKTLDEPAFEVAIVPEIPISDFLAVKQAWEWKRRMEGLRVGPRSVACA